jgi:hypothetical protein
MRRRRSSSGDKIVIRFLFRLLGYMTVGGGFVLLVLDGARSVANQAFSPTPFGEIAFRALGERYLLLQPAIERHVHPFLWDPVVLNLTLLPAFAVLLALGFLLLLIGRTPSPGIGTLTRA